jgi:mRNA interferase RelE/StbE
MTSGKTYTVKYEKRAEKFLDKLDPVTRKLILAWVNKNLHGCSNPRAIGKSLKGSQSGKWRYRVGDWRLLANISDSEVVIYVFKIGNRKDVYRGQ